MRVCECVSECICLFSFISVTYAQIWLQFGMNVENPGLTDKLFIREPRELNRRELVLYKYIGTYESHYNVFHVFQ